MLVDGPSAGRPYRLPSRLFLAIDDVAIPVSAPPPAPGRAHALNGAFAGRARSTKERAGPTMHVGVVAVSDPQFGAGLSKHSHMISRPRPADRGADFESRCFITRPLCASNFQLQRRGYVSVLGLRVTWFNGGKAQIGLSYCIFPWLPPQACAETLRICHT